MIKLTKLAASVVLLALTLLMARTTGCESRLQAARSHQGRCSRKALQVGLRSLPGERRVRVDTRRKCGAQYRILINLLAHRASQGVAALGHRCSGSRARRPRGWSTLPKLIVYHLDKSLIAQLAEIGLKAGDIGTVAISHTHGDHIGNIDYSPTRQS